MEQRINGKLVYVVEFDTMPELPITGLTEEEALYEAMIQNVVPGNQNGLLHTFRDITTYAQILTHAIGTGVITEPGKYGLHKDHAHHRWEAFKIEE